MVKLTNRSKQTVKPQIYVEPGEEIEVPERVAADLERSTPELSGEASSEPQPDISSLTKDELYQLAQDRDIEGKALEES